jgi:hypothetical protein
MAENDPPNRRRPPTKSLRLRSRHNLQLQPPPGMWAATGTAIAYAPTLTELREPVADGENIEFDANGHCSRAVTTNSNGEPS